MTLYTSNISKTTGKSYHQMKRDAGLVRISMWTPEKDFKELRSALKKAIELELTDQLIKRITNLTKEHQSKE